MPLKFPRAAPTLFHPSPGKQQTFSVPYRRRNKQATIIRRFALEYSSLRIKRQDNWTSNLKVVV